MRKRQKKPVVSLLARHRSKNDDEGSWRVHKGSDYNKQSRKVVDNEEADILPEGDKDALSSKQEWFYTPLNYSNAIDDDCFGAGHRYDEMKQHRRHRPAGSDVVISRRKGLMDPLTDLYGSTPIDHMPHDVSFIGLVLCRRG